MKGEVDVLIDQISSDPNVLRKGFTQAVRLPVKLLGFGSKLLTLAVVVVFLTDPTPHGLVNAAWFYVIGKIVSVIVEGAVGWGNGLRQTKFFNGLPESQQRRPTKMFLTNHALQGFFGLHTPVLFLDWRATIIREILDKGLETVFW